MPRKAFLLGGSGQTGRALIPRLLERGWDVTVASRGGRALPADVEHVRVDRDDSTALRAAVGAGADVLVDSVAFEQKHARQLLELRGVVRSLVVISTAAVYFPEDEGEFSRLPVPIPETYRTVAPGNDGYAANKAAIEADLLAQDDMPATLIRAGAIYGPWSSWSREWYFVKRVLDRRPFVVLAYRGESRFHPVSVHNLAELIWLAAERPARRVVNAGDPSPPTVLEISRAITAAVDHDWTEVLIDEPRAGVGETVWSTKHPVVLDMTEAEFELGYRPVTTYARAVAETVEWLVEATREAPWEEVLPRSAEYMAQSFDYDAENAFVGGLGRG